MSLLQNTTVVKWMQTLRAKINIQAKKVRFELGYLVSSLNNVKQILRSINIFLKQVECNFNVISYMYTICI